MGEKGRTLTRAEAARLAGVPEAELRGRERKGNSDAFSSSNNVAEHGRLSQNTGAFSKTVHAGKPAGATPENPSGAPLTAPSADMCDRAPISGAQHLYLDNCV